jgi:hypothetical protein
MKRVESIAAAFREQLREKRGGWEGAFGLDPEPQFFGGWESMPCFEYETAGFSPARAWWLAELCRLAYTQNDKERFKYPDLTAPVRAGILRERTPFAEVLSVHKTGNHASIYRFRDGGGPTIVCFRGSTRTRQWILNALFRSHRWERFRSAEDPETAFVHSGIYVILKRIWPLLEEELRRCPRPWILTGHSLGGALAVLAGALVLPDLVCTFGAPKVGSRDFFQLKNGGETWRIVNGIDLVPRLPLATGPQVASGSDLVHGVPAMRLLEGGVLSAFASETEENSLPFDLKTLSGQLDRAPDWLLDHRMGGYCGRLQALHEAMMQD